MAESAGAEADPDRSHGYLAVLVLLTVVAVVLVGVGVILGLKVMQNDAEQARRQNAVRTAGEVALKLTTIDHRNAEGELAQLRTLTTPQFAEQFGIRSHAFADTLAQSRIVSTGQVTSAGLEQLADRSARVLVAVRATVRDGGAPQGEPRSYQLGVDLQRQDDRWLVSNVEFLL